MAVEYKVIKKKNDSSFFGKDGDDGRDAFCEKVANQLNKGWQLSGGICVIKDDGEPVYYQAVYRDDGK